MEWICTEENYIIKKEYQVAHQQFSFILQLFLAIHKKNDQESLAILKKIDDKKWILSYYSYINIFNCIGNYHYTKDKHEKNKFLQKYNKLCAPLNYPVFDEKYLKNYFN